MEFAERAAKRDEQYGLVPVLALAVACRGHSQNPVSTLFYWKVLRCQRQRRTTPIALEALSHESRQLASPSWIASGWPGFHAYNGTTHETSTGSQKGNIDCV